MQTARLTVFDIQKDKEAIKTACEILIRGGLVAIPTETVYGLAANTFDETAVAKIFEAKGRPQDNPLIVHVCDRKMLESVVKELPPKALEGIRCLRRLVQDSILLLCVCRRAKLQER